VKIRILLAVLFALGLVAFTACDSPKSKTPAGESMERLVLGISYPGNLSFLIWVAEDRGYFAEHGLKMEVKLYESGLAATKDLAAGKVDLATATDFVTARYILERTHLRIITSICESDDVKLVARKDHGITQISDIRHKRVGVLHGGGGEFFLDLLLASQNIPSQEVQKVDLPPSEQAKAISKGDVDAVVIWEPFLTEVRNNLGTNALTWSAQSGQSYYWLLLGKADVISKRSRAINGFLSSLVSAEKFIKNHEDDAKTIVARKLGVSDRESLWKGTLFEVGLDHPLILTIEAQMRWMNPDLQTDQSNMPDILTFIYFDALNSVQPQRIKMLY
jgi:ABC-type nitrate/sulfonate/bicarbonate transport system substrate-binding protein